MGEIATPFPHTPIPPTPLRPPTVASTVKKYCHPSYPDICIPLTPADLNCKDNSRKRFTVLPPDPHHFDGDKDSIGCER